MIAAFLEAIRSTAQPCTLPLIAVIAGALWASRATPASAAAVAGAATSGGWALVAGAAVPTGAWLVVSGVLGVIGLSALVWLGQSPRWRPSWLVPAIAGTVTYLGAAWWRPCVGQELGRILSEGIGDPVGQLPAMTAYMAGVLTVVAIPALAVRAVTDSPEAGAVLAWAGFIVAVPTAMAVALCRHDDLVGELARLTLS